MLRLTTGGRCRACLPPSPFWALLVALAGATSAAAQVVDLPPGDSLVVREALRLDSLRRADSLRAAQRAAARPPDTARARPIGRVFSRTARTVRPDSLLGWTQRVTVALHVSQSAYRNWTPGGQNTLASTARLDGRFERLGRRWDALYTLRVGYGVVRLDTLALRKAEDETRLEGTWRYLAPSAFGELQPTLAARARTQVAPGYAYTRNPYRDGRPLPVRVSGPLSPAELALSAGLTYERSRRFRQRLGLGVRYTLVQEPAFRVLYGLEDDQRVRTDAGVESRTEVELAPMENVTLRSSLGLFAPIVPTRRPDATWETRALLRVNRWLQANVEADLVYDVTRSERVQLREAFTLGLTVRVL